MLTIKLPNPNIIVDHENLWDNNIKLVKSWIHNHPEPVYNSGNSLLPLPTTATMTKTGYDLVMDNEPGIRAEWSSKSV